ncbi:LLM class F420-dependent oxidoreductase [Emcibacter sp. SYSU 3D8]|uniref:LLM class F420-dependent oxidoreductase n=1 Tax=Emcibacter sp. SYSU 3D8 TaxID=3133969 RepID=UPI0031FEF5AB
MKLGAVFPFTDVNDDPYAIRDFVQAVDEMGYDHIVVYDHVLGSNPASRPGFSMPFTHLSPFYDPLVLFGHMSAISRRLEFLSAVLILPQRQAALVAKQAAIADVLAGGRIRLGVGSGWNEAEYEALGADFANRGAVMDEQIDLMRALWKANAISFKGRFHTVTDSGICPLPPRKGMPIWIGGTTAPAMRRAARTGDGWLPYAPAREAAPLMERFRTIMAEAGRELDGFGVEAIMFAHGDDRPDFGNPARTLDDAFADAEVWRREGVTHLSVHSMATNAGDVPSHVAFLEQFIRGLAR